MANNLEDEILESFNIGEEVILESVDTNSVLDSRIVEKMKVGDRVNADLRYHRRNVPKSKSSYKRNDLPRTYLLADALLGEVKEYLSQEVVQDSAIISVSDSIQAEEWSPYAHSEINGKILSEKDSEHLRELYQNGFMSLKYGGNVYFVSEDLLESEGVSDEFIKTHGLDEVIQKFSNHLGLEISTLKVKLPDSKTEIIAVYSKMPEQSVFPGKEREHTSLLMENTYESAGNGYGSRVPDELVKGGDEFLENLPTPEEMEALSRNKSDELPIRKRFTPLSDDVRDITK